MLHHHRRTVSILSLLGALALGQAPGTALPKLDSPYPLPATFNGIITIYPDSENTTQIRRYWLVPSTARIVRRPDNKLAFGLVHSGISGWDPDGIGALLNVTIQPYVDDKTLSSAKTLIQQQATAEGATSVTFNYISPTETTAQIMVGGQYLDWLGKQTNTVIPGGTVEAGLPFQVKLTNSFDARCLAQSGGDDAAIFGALFTMKFLGVGNPVHFKVTANLQEVYTHFKARIQASAGLFGWAKVDAKTEWQNLKTLPSVTLQVFSGTQEDVEKFHAQEILDSLLRQVTERTGLFAQRLQPSGLPDAPGGGGFLGWGISAGGGFEGYDQTTTLVYEVDAQFTRSQTIAFGMNFPVGGAEMKDGSYVKNLTDSNKPYPNSDDFKKRRSEEGACVKAKIATLKAWRDDGTIDADLYKLEVTDVLNKGCYSKIPDTGPSPGFAFAHPGVSLLKYLPESLRKPNSALSPLDQEQKKAQLRLLLEYDRSRR